AAGNQGIVLNRLKRYEQTIALLTALVREPDCDDMAFAPLADALIKTGRDEEAAGYAFEVALRFQNNQSLWHLAAQTYARIGDEAGVARALELMCRFNVDVDWQTYTDLSNYY